MGSMMASQTPHREYATRPLDERYPNVPALVRAALEQKQNSAQVNYNLRDLQFVPTDTDPDNEQATVMLRSPKAQATLSNWAFGQVSSMLGASASFLRKLPPINIANDLNHMIKIAPVGQTAHLLIEATDDDTNQIRSFNGEAYSRVWDCELYGEIHRQIMSHDPAWSVPKTWGGEPSGCNRGDRDSFLIITNGGSLVTDPSLSRAAVWSWRKAAASQPGNTSPDGPTDGMYRGLLIRNSEVGNASIEIERILFRVICGNHMLWSAVLQRQFRRRHVGKRVLRDVMREIGEIAREWTNASAARDEAVIRGMIDHEIAHTQEAVIDELKKIGYTEKSARQAYDLCVRTESVSPRSFWGIAQGTTRASQEQQFNDGRYELDQLAAKVLARGAALVRA
jgi:hypothetical protein